MPDTIIKSTLISACAKGIRPEKALGHVLQQMEHVLQQIFQAPRGTLDFGGVSACAYNIS